MNYITSIIGGIFLSISSVIIWNSLQDKKITHRNLKVYIFLILFSAILILNYNISSSMIKFLSVTLAMFISIELLYKTSLRLSMLMALYIQIINIISELVFSILLILLFDFRIGEYTSLQILSANIFVSVFSVLLIKTKICKNIFKNLVDVTSKIRLRTLLVMALSIIIITNMYLAITYYSYDPLYYIVINTLSIYIIMLITYFLAKKENDYIKVSNKYNIMLKSLKEYETMLDQYRISNHENKNQLLTVRNMLPDGDIETRNYIDKIVQNNLKDNNNIMIKVSKIPSGGLKGLIYSKLLVMKEKKINYNLNISRGVSTIDLIKLDDNVVLDICKIIGVYLDNSIEAVEELNEKSISIEMYMQDENLIIRISNNYEGLLDINKIDEKGYTSKGSGHGYGLPLTKKLINNNSRLSNNKSISGNIFSQELVIKI